MRKTDKFRIFSAVYDDLKAGQRFYDEHEPGVGDYFYESLIVDIHSLILYAGIHPQDDELYRMPAKRFPYFIYYLIEEQDIWIVAVLPMRRHPDWVKQQLERRSR